MKYTDLLVYTCKYENQVKKVIKCLNIYYNCLNFNYMDLNNLNLLSGVDEDDDE